MRFGDFLRVLFREHDGKHAVIEGSFDVLLFDITYIVGSGRGARESFAMDIMAFLILIVFLTVYLRRDGELTII